MTLPRIRNTHELLFLVTGEDKAEAASRALAGDPSPGTPGSLARAAEDGTTRAILDRAAAVML
jgi:6-phosphogluconolactonase/glucosamine-6-phosphate isomerase/deaminase